jgi:hypothetical protein
MIIIIFVVVVIILIVIIIIALSLSLKIDPYFSFSVCHFVKFSFELIRYIQNTNYHAQIWYY